MFKQGTARASRMSVMFSLTIALTFSGVIGATPAQAETTFTISGTVTDTNGDPVPCFVSADMSFVGSPIHGIGSCSQFSAVSSAGIKNISVAGAFDLYGNYIDLLGTSPDRVDAFNLSATINIETNTTLNIVLPIAARTPRSVTVVDQSSIPIEGVRVGTSVTGVANFGTSNSWRFDLVDPYNFDGPRRPALGSQCTTGADGSCIISRFSFLPETGITGEAFMLGGYGEPSHPTGSLIGSAPLSLSPTTIVATRLRAEASITGTVKRASGETVEGAVVRTSDGSTATTGSDGTYELWVLADSLVRVAGYASIDRSTREIIAPPPLVGSQNLSEPCSGTGIESTYNSLPECVVIGTVEEFQISSDRSINIELPLMVEQQFHVQDAEGVPVEGAIVSKNNVFTAGSVNYTAEGSAVTHMFDAPALSGWGYCFTDAAGNCSQTFLSESVTAQEPIWALDFLSNDPIRQCWTGRSWNGNLGLPLMAIVLAPFNTCAVSQSMGTTSGEVSISTASAAETSDLIDGTTLDLTDVTIVEAPTLPAGLISPTGELSYTVNNVPIGGSVDVTIDLPAGSAPTAVYKNTASGLIDVSSIATITGDTIVMHLTDGEFGDEDGVANGVIVDPAIPVRTTTTSIGLTSTRNDPIFGQRTLLKTVITGPTGRRIPSGTVSFSDGSTPLGTATVRSGRANFILPPTSAAGVHQITATYLDATGQTSSAVSAPLAITVAQATTRMALSGPSSGRVGIAVLLKVRVVNLAPGKGAATGNVSFTDNGVALGSAQLDAYGRATFSTTNLLRGSHTIVATYAGDTNHTSSNSSRSLAVL